MTSENEVCWRFIEVVLFLKHARELSIVVMTNVAFMSSAADSALIAGMSLSIWFLCLSYRHSHATSMSLQHLLQKIDDLILGWGTAIALLPGRTHSRKDSRASSHANVYFFVHHSNTYITVGWKILWKRLQKQSFEITENTSNGRLTLFWTSACLLTFYSRFSPHLLITRIHFRLSTIQWVSRRKSDLFFFSF